MKLLRLRITDPEGFRSLQSGFEYHFRTEWDLQEEQGFAPFVCAGPNGSGKSNLLEALAAIFFQLEVLRVRRRFLPQAFIFDALENPYGLKDGHGIPNAFELEYLIGIPKDIYPLQRATYGRVLVTKQVDESPRIQWLNEEEFAQAGDIALRDGLATEREREFLLPQHVLGYSSGENQILSLPFFKMRFIQFDEYWNALKEQLPYPGRPDARLAYLDNSLSQAILLCNWLFQNNDALAPFREDIGVGELKEFRIIIKRNIEIAAETVFEFQGKDKPAFESVYDVAKFHPALSVVDSVEGQEKRFQVNVVKLLDAGADSSKNFDPIIARLKRCATCFFVDEKTDTLYLDYCVNEATKKAFKANFDQSAIALFQAFQVLLALNLYSVTDKLKADLYKSDSHYVGETVPTLASDQRIMRFKFVKFTKEGIKGHVMLKSLSDGEHQLLHSLGLCLLFKGTNSLFLLDEPETHFNPDWRSTFITRLNQCFSGKEGLDEMLVTTHTPFLISDSKPAKVLVFKKDKEAGTVTIRKPEYNTLGASINKITMSTFLKRETIGGRAEEMLAGFRNRFAAGEDKEQLINKINSTLGDSVEKMMLIKVILDSMEGEG